MYKDVHAAIKKNPDRAKKEEKKVPEGSKPKRYRSFKSTY